MEKEEETKECSERIIPFTPLEQVHSDFALAITLQEQERAFAMLTTIESTSEEDEEEESDFSDSYHDDIEYLGAELEFPEEEDSNSDEEMDEDDGLDIDELSYEDMIALGEFIGEEKRGLSTSEIPKCLSACKYQSMEIKTGIDRCVVCQVEYEEGETLVALHCEHPYHAECISKWLQVKKICPICSTEVSPVPNIAKTT
ncbi:E3 ubiquitin ligase BIG BROTHER-related [Juglans microcarpa x Juglans regia]|uniref:E3 ubiquitin ligase BIG BROTHER-related n=1 Tax=Juglans microcarpa x Juglans regia TaxID=2249226 RepID=UPI001B7F1659|nr:E3 ubiquitin ligase BIG BROTHER-related [Juglans microcarpa x Juglans regia]